MTPAHDDQERLRQLEEENRALRAACAQRMQNILLASIVENADEAIIGKTLDGIITSWNPAAERLYGYTAIEAIGQSINIIIPPEHAGELERILERIRHGERIGHYETVRVTRDGRRLDVVVTVSPICDAPGHIIGASSIAHDVTARKQAEVELRRLNETLEQRVHDRTAQLEATNKELEAFSYSVSHDLRAPLRTIDGFSKIILDRYAGQLDATGQDYLTRMRNAAVCMGRLIDEMLKLSRIGRAELVRQPVNLSDLAAAVIADLRQRDPERQVEVEITPGMQVSADPGMLRIVLENLLGNAWKFTGRTEHARIEVGAMTQENERVFFIRDNGAGFDMSYADKLFTPFQRLHTEEEFPGTGIGLAIVQRIIAKHGGRVWAEGKEGEGATINFTLGEER